MTTYFAKDGNFGDADGLVIIELDNFPDWQVDYLCDELSDTDRYKLALKVALNPSEESFEDSE